MVAGIAWAWLSTRSRTAGSPIRAASSGSVRPWLISAKAGSCWKKWWVWRESTALSGRASTWAKSCAPSALAASIQERMRRQRSGSGWNWTRLKVMGQPPSRDMRRIRSVSRSAVVQSSSSVP